MRPVARPVCPIPQPRDYHAYLESLRLVFGVYCSYCERPDKLDVEHVIPKSRQPALELEWNNLLLGCARCNRDFKRSNNLSRLGYIWPDTHDTYHSFEYLVDGRVKAVIGPAQVEAKAIADLVKLEDSKHQSVLNLGRRNAFKIAQYMLQSYRNGHASLDNVMVQVQQGYWSVWMTVFVGEPAVVAALIDPQYFPGTAVQYF
ncbi:HNH endonuclease [Rheinheimera soli]|uniref:Uncharacterized protein (TIGR02646 family) n=1 Tax=Rheinheimera soli TaxID=443616 RepID=A0ABU1W3T1_9GAMM|nr:HNH endonuclease [Rheinheimera soli]MDR7122589.1 uncharacterized protein (TIGR02646 family) [Rheinheimera soli]